MRMVICHTFDVDHGGWFEWDEGNEEHIVCHRVDPIEVEEALLDPGGVGSGAYDLGGELRWSVIGATDAGRILLVVYTLRDGKVRPITARDANKTQKRRYRRR